MTDRRSGRLLQASTLLIECCCRLSEARMRGQLKDYGNADGSGSTGNCSARSIFPLHDFGCRGRCDWVISRRKTSGVRSDARLRGRESDHLQRRRLHHPFSSPPRRPVFRPSSPPPQIHSSPSILGPPICAPLRGRLLVPCSACQRRSLGKFFFFFFDLFGPTKKLSLPTCICPCGRPLPARGSRRHDHASICSANQR